MIREETAVPHLSRRLPTTICLLAATATLLTACGTSSGGSAKQAATGFPLTVTSCGGQKVTFANAPARIFSSGSDAALAVAAAGATDRLVGRSQDGGHQTPLGHYATELNKVPQITVSETPSREQVIALRPDVVVTNGPANVPAAVSEGINTLTPTWRCGGVSFEDTYNQIEQYGKVFGTSKAADRTVAALHARQATVVKQARNKFQGLTVGAINDDAPFFGAYGRASVTHSMFGILGMKDVFGDLKDRIPEVGVETVTNRDPDVLVLVYSETGETAQQAIQLLTQRKPALKTLKAVRQGHVIPINFNYIIGGPLIVDGLEQIAKSMKAAGIGQ